MGAVLVSISVVPKVLIATNVNLISKKRLHSLRSEYPNVRNERKKNMQQRQRTHLTQQPERDVNN